MASRLQDVILRGLAADKPLATDVANGTLYYSSDTFSTERSDGTVWESFSDVVGGGIPGIHAPSHLSAGSDPIDVTALAGFPGGITDYLRADGSFAPLPASSVRYAAIVMVIDGGVAVITSGIKGFLEIPFACTILGWTLLSTDAAVLAGSATIDIWKDTLANYPPTVADTITAGAKPVLSAVNKNSGAPTGWNTTINAGDILGFNVDLATTVTKVTLTLKVQMV